MIAERSCLCRIVPANADVYIATLNAVPEPATIALAAIGFAIIAPGSETYSLRRSERNLVRLCGGKGFQAVQTAEHCIAGDFAPAGGLVAEDGELEAFEGFVQVVGQSRAGRRTDGREQRA